MTKTFNDVCRHKKADFVQKLQKLVILGHSLSHRKSFRFSPRRPPGPYNAHEPHKDQLISKAMFLFSFEPKNERNYFLISALASKKSSNEKTLLCNYVE